MAEKRLIDYDYIRQKAFADPDSGEAIVYLQDIDEAPTVDAVEVVRCKDCKWWHKKYETNGICLNGRNEIICFSNQDFFCAHGERRTDG